MTIVIIGNGMYVSGRGTKGYGTIMPAIFEYIRRGGSSIKEIKMVGTNRDGAIKAQKKVKELMDKMDISIIVKTYPINSENNSISYEHVLGNVDLPACAIVAVPDHLHFEIARFCLMKGLHTLVVKPLTPTTEEAIKLTKLASKKNLYGAVEFHKRWDRHNLMLKDLFQKGEFGKPLYTWTEYSQRKSIPSKVFISWVEKSNILQYLGVHYIDIIRFITKAYPKRVMAIGQRKWLKGQSLNVDDAIQCMIEWEMDNGDLFTQTLLTNWIDPENTSAMSDQKIKFVGTKGRFDNNQKNRGISFIVGENSLETPNPDFSHSYRTMNGQLSWQGYGIESIITFLKDSQQVINNKKIPIDFEEIRPTFKEALISTATIDAASKSIKNNNIWIKVRH